MTFEAVIGEDAPMQWLQNDKCVIMPIITRCGSGGGMKFKRSIKMNKGRLSLQRFTPRQLLLIVVVVISFVAGINITGLSGAATAAAMESAVNISSPSSDGKFSIVVIPDTQYTLTSWPADFTTMMTWIKNNTAAENTKFVIHVGDVVDIPTATNMWVNAQAGMNLLDGTVPYVLAVGNHDMDAYPNSAGIRDTVQFNTYFPVSKFQNWSWQTMVSNYGVGGAQGPNDNSAHKFTAGGTDYLVVTLKYRPSSSEMSWANNVITANPTRRVILATHEYMDGEGVRSIAGEKIWNTVASKHKNVQFVLSGHFTFASRRTDAGVNGNPVHQILSDYQTPGVREPNSYLRIMTFDPALGTVSVRTYSPPFNKNYTTDRDQFTLSNIQYGPIGPGVITTGEVTEARTVPYQQVTTYDPTLPAGTSTVTQQGINGEETVVYTVTYTDGVETGRVVKSSEVITQPTDQITVVGTMQTGPATTEYVSNKSFETSLTGWGTATTTSRNTRTIGGYEGAYAARSLNNAAANTKHGIMGSPSWIDGRTKTTSVGKIYTATAWVKPDAAGQRISIYLREVNASGATVRSKTAAITSMAGWQKITNAYTAAGSGNKLEYHVFSTNSASQKGFMADDIGLTTPN